MWMFVERKLEEAARAGAFDRLPGAGLPIALEDHPFVPADWRLSFKILADHGVIPEFAERRRAIESIRSEMADLRSDVGRDRAWRRLAYHNRLIRLRDEVQALNQCLVRENHFIRGSLQLPPIDMESELAEFDRSA